MLLKRQGIVLPSLILLTLVMVVLCAILISSGTAGLRTATKASHDEQAMYAAEAGLVQVAARFARGEVTKERTQYSGNLKANSDVRWEVTAIMNKKPQSTPGEATPEGTIVIPPKTTYLRSVGISSDGTQRVMGALFTLGAGSFRAGVVADRIRAEGSHFVAYDSRANLDPDLNSTLPTSQGILTSNLRGTPSDPQFSFLADSTVTGDVYTAKGTIEPKDEIHGYENVSGLLGVLDEKILIPEIKLPRVDPGEQSDPDGNGGDGDLRDGTHETGIGLLTASWNGNANEWTFSHHSKNISLPNLKPEPGTYPMRGGDSIEIRSDGSISFYHKQERKTYSGNLPEATLPSSLNPPTLKGGSYKQVRVNDNNETKLQEGEVFVVENLEIAAGGKLTLATDSPVTIYVTKKLTVMGENAIANSSKKPPNLKIYYLGTDPVNLAGGSEAYFTLIAPFADVTLAGEAPAVVDPAEPAPTDPTADPTADPDNPTDPSDPTDPSTPTEPPTPTPSSTATTSFYGALVGKNVTVKNANFFFDVATDGVGEGSDSNTFVLLSRHRF